MQTKRLFGTWVLGLGLAMSLLWLLSDDMFSARAAAAVRYVTTTGNDTGDCATIVGRCRTVQYAVNVASPFDEIWVAGGTYTSAGEVVITITKSFTLYGGWDGVSVGVRNSAAYPTILDGENARRVIQITGNVSPTIDGFTITGGNATGLGGGLFAGSDAGGGIYSLNASPIIQNNIITNNVASTQSGVRALGGGIYIKDAPTLAVIRYNQIMSNTAGIGIQQGEGGGLFIYSPADVLTNTFRDNEACKSCTRSLGGGLDVGWTTSQILIAHNLFENNQARQGGGIHLVWSAVQVNGNTIISNTATDDGAGLFSTYDKGSNVNANIVMSNTAARYGGGLVIYITQGPEATRLVNNIIAHNLAGDSGGGLYAHSDWNLSAITLTHNTVASNGTGLRIGDNMTATLVNNIVASHTLGITVTGPGGNVFADHTLFWGNTDDGIRGANSVDGDPAFVNPAAGDYHIGPGSGAIDAGVAAGVISDIDGELRPDCVLGDIGADERQGAACSRIYLPLVLRDSS